MAEYPISKSQARLTSILNLTTDGTANHAARVLEAAGYSPDAVPAGGTWRTAAKLTDDELVAATRLSQDREPRIVSTETTAEYRASQYSGPRTAGDYIRAAKARARQGSTYVPRGNDEDILDDLAAANVQPADQATGQRQLREDY